MELLTVIKCSTARDAAATAVRDPTHRLLVHVCMRVYAHGNCPHSVCIFSEFCSSVLFLDNVITSFLIIYFLL